MNRKILVFLFLLFSNCVNAQVNLIFDTDFGGDVDDLGALCMLNNLIDKKECKVMAVMCWSTEKYAVAAIDAVNRYYKHPKIPIGARSGNPHYHAWNYSESLAVKFKSEKSYANVPEATSLYRKILAESKDSSIVIVAVGPLKNIQNLLNSGSDEYSNLSGKDLLAKKVKEFVIMGGQFPESKGAEWNFDGNMPGVTKYALQNLKVSTVFCGAEVGARIKSGKVMNHINPNTPLYVGWMHFSLNAPWMKKLYTGKAIDNSCFDQTAVLYAVRNGIGVYWDKIKGGYCEVDEEGNNKWVSGADTNQSYLKLKMEPTKIAALIEGLMLNR